MSVHVTADGAPKSPANSWVCALQALEDPGALNMKRAEHKDLRQRVWSLRDSVTAYDAAYVVLAEILDSPLITCDAKLARSNGHKARIELIE